MKTIKNTFTALIVFGFVIWATLSLGFYSREKVKDIRIDFSTPQWLSNFIENWDPSELSWTAYAIIGLILALIVSKMVKSRGLMVLITLAVLCFIGSSRIL